MVFQANFRILGYCTTTSPCRLRSQDFLSMPQPPMYPEQDPWTEEDTRAVQQETGGDFGDCQGNWRKNMKKSKVGKSSEIRGKT